MADYKKHIACVHNHFIIKQKHIKAIIDLKLLRNYIDTMAGVVQKQPTHASRTTYHDTDQGSGPLVFAIITTVFAVCCCWWALFCSIPAIIFANKVSYFCETLLGASRCACIAYVAVTGRNQTLFLTTFLIIRVFVSMSQNLLECSKLAYSNSYI